MKKPQKLTKEKAIRISFMTGGQTSVVEILAINKMDNIKYDKMLLNRKIKQFINWCEKNDFDVKKYLEHIK